MWSQNQPGMMMTSGSVLEPPHRLLLPSALYSSAAPKSATFRSWKEPPTTRKQWKGFSSVQPGRLCISAYHTTLPTGNSEAVQNGVAGEENGYALTPSAPLSAATNNSSSPLTNEVQSKLEIVTDRLNSPEENGYALTPSPPLSVATNNGSSLLTSEVQSELENVIDRLNSPEENVYELTPSPPLSVANNNGSSLLTSEVQSNLENVIDRLNSPNRVTEILEVLEEHGSSLDPELEGIVNNIADVQKQNEMLGERMKDIQELLGKTTRLLNARAQEAKIEAAKLKKLAKLHQIEELRRVETLRRSKFEARLARLDLGGTTDPTNTSTTTDGQGEAVSPEGISGILQPQSDLVTFPEAGQESAAIELLQPYFRSAGFVQTYEGTEQNEKIQLTGEEILPNQPENQQGEVSEVEEEPNQEESSSSEDTQEEDIMERASVISESYECFMTHPGAVSCTKTVIKSDPSKKSAVIVMETTVKCEGDGCSVESIEENDYIALAIQSLSETAEEVKQSRFATARDPGPVVYNKHARILDLLVNGRVVKAKPMDPPSKFGHEAFVTELMNKQTGEKIEAMFKPGIEGHADGWHRAPIEMVAYKLNLMLGMDYVPPAAYKSGGVDVNYKRYHDGAFVYYVPNTKPLRKVPATNWGVSVALLLSDTRILDVLLNNSDRHDGHFLFGEHWADGQMRPVLIDHAAGFRKEATVKMDHENAFQTGAVKVVSAKTYLRLRFLEKHNVETTFKGLLFPREVNELMQRRDMILSYLDNLVKDRGYHRTVVES